MKTLKKQIPYILLGATLLLLLGLNIISQDHWLDSDMAAEMIFSRILSEEHHIFSTTNWYYSTEFRVLYTQLIMGPLFRICSNWHVIRTITNLVFYGLMLASYYYFMKPLKVSRGLTVLSSCLLLLPFSETMMTHMQMGNTYMSHVILVLWFFGMYLRLCSGEYHAKRKVSLWIFYVLLAIVCGMSGVRYLLALQCPLVLTSFFYLLGGEVTSVDNQTLFSSPENPSTFTGNIYVTKAFTSVSGVDLKAGLTVNSIISTYIYHKLPSIAKSWYLMVDHTKFNRTAMYPVATLSDIKCLIADHVTEDYAAVLRELNVELRVPGV